MPARGRCLVGAVAAAFALLLHAGCASSPPPPVVAPTAATLPAVDLLALDGKPTRIEALLGGRPALISLWATWCEACATEFDALSRLDAKLRVSGAAMVVAVAVGEAPAVVAPFVATRGLPYAQLSDADFAFADRLGQKRVPATLVVDRAGRVVFIGAALDAAALAALAEQLR